MKRDEHGCLRMPTEAEMAAECAEADALNDARGCEIENPLSYMDKSIQITLRASYDAHMGLAEVYRKELAALILPIHMATVEKYVAARVRALAARDTIERLGLRG